MTTEARRAVAADAAELTRLREEMFTALHGERPEPDQWQRDASAELRKQLADPEGTMAAFVDDDPGQPDRLASCAIGTIDERLPGPNRPTGLSGFVMSVATDPGHRRRGYSRACMSALLDWFRDRGLSQVNLIASPDGEPLYRQLGFGHGNGTAMRLRMSEPATTPRQ